MRGILRSFEAAARNTHYSDPGLAAVMELSAESVKSGGWVQHTGLLGWYVGKGVIPYTFVCAVASGLETVHRTLLHRRTVTAGMEVVEGMRPLLPLSFLCGVPWFWPHRSAFLVFFAGLLAVIRGCAHAMTCASQSNHM